MEKKFPGCVSAVKPIGGHISEVTDFVRGQLGDLPVRKRPVFWRLLSRATGENL
jgi:hypothetical protein